MKSFSNIKIVKDFYRQYNGVEFAHEILFEKISLEDNLNLP